MHRLFTSKYVTQHTLYRKLAVTSHLYMITKHTLKCVVNTRFLEALLLNVDDLQETFKTIIS